MILAGAAGDGVNIFFFKKGGVKFYLRGWLVAGTMKFFTLYSLLDCWCSGSCCFYLLMMNLL